MRIIVIGQCTLHWGRMEFGNIGNYYIMEPFFRSLHGAFPNAEISTTFQMSDEFCFRERVTRLPMSLYYNWENDLELSMMELEQAYHFEETNYLENETPYISCIKDADLVIDFSGDMWGENANFLGDNRFLVGLIKDRVAQIFAKRTVMLAGSPGPFNPKMGLSFTKEVFKNFDLVTNREFISKEMLEDYGFDISKTESLACPAFGFEPGDISTIKDLDTVSKIFESDRKAVGFLICGWNFTEGPFDKWPRNDADYDVFVSAIQEFLEFNDDADIYLMSHSNGFPIPPNDFRLLHGRDYLIIKQLEELLHKAGLGDRVIALDGIYDAWQTKAILGQFDMVVSGRVHAAVGAMSQNIPTVIIDYGHEPRAHKLRGFAEVTGQQAYLAYPHQERDLFKKMDEVWNNRERVKGILETEIPKVKSLANKNFELLKTLF